MSTGLSIPSYHRLATREVRIGNLFLGAGHPIRIQTMTTTDTMDTAATVAQTIRCIEAGAELVRITAPNKKEAENLAEIKKQVRAAGYDTPLVADIHFTPNAAEIAARIVEKVRVNPGNYVDKKKFDQIEYTDEEYAAEIDRIRERFTPLVLICKEEGTAMRIGTNHGSLSDRIMSRYGDTAIGMVESAMEFLRIARAEDYHQIVLSMKSSNPIVMVEAYRLLVKHMQDEFGECYPLHLGVTEAGDGEDGRIKSAIGIGTLLHEGIGDTIRVSLTEEPEFELPVCRDIVESIKSKDKRRKLFSETHSANEENPASNQNETSSEAQVFHNTSPLLEGSGEARESGEASSTYATAIPFLYPVLRKFADLNKKNETKAEAILWQHLKNRQLNEHKFRRQHIVSRYIADFVCLTKGLIIEVDGKIHQHPDNRESDRERTLNLNELGFEVVRFTNEEIETRIDNVLQKINDTLESSGTQRERLALKNPFNASPIPSNRGGYGETHSANEENPASNQNETSSEAQVFHNTSPLLEGSGEANHSVQNIGAHHVPVVFADFMQAKTVKPEDLSAIGYGYDPLTDKWNISDGAADYIYLADKTIDFELPGTLRPVMNANAWNGLPNRDGYVPLFDLKDFDGAIASPVQNFVSIDVTENLLEDETVSEKLNSIKNDPSIVLCIYSSANDPLVALRAMHEYLAENNFIQPLIICAESHSKTVDEQLIDFSVNAGALFLDGIGNGIWLMNDPSKMKDQKISGRTYLEVKNNHQFLNNTSFSILQATRKRISKTEYISCPSCGRTLFDLQETTAKIRAATHHLKGLKIAIMGCIVNGPGEMADADFGYVGSGPGKITLYRGKEVMKRNVPSEVAVEELIGLLKENGVWAER